MSLTVVESYPVATSELDDLSTEIARQHVLVRQSMADSLNHAIATGELLLRAKAMVEVGHWDEWLSDQALIWDMSIEWARSYMRFARFKDLILAEQLPSVKAARKFLRQSNVQDVRVDPTRRLECDRLHKEGLSQKEIADELGVSAPTIWRWLNPEKEQKYRRLRARNSRAGRSALRAKERSDAAKRVGGDLGEGYGLVRLALDNLERAAAQQTGEARREIRSAMNSLYNAEDATAKAVKLAEIDAR